MPIYEYKCRKCNSKFELMRPLSKSNEPAPCPRCQQNAERIMSTFACFSTSESGFTEPVGGGSSCAGCSGMNCDSCGM